MQLQAALNTTRTAGHLVRNDGEGGANDENEDREHRREEHVAAMGADKAREQKGTGKRVRHRFQEGEGVFTW